jgi:hypothetical protein
MGVLLPPRQQMAYTAIQALRAEGMRLCMTPQLLHILQRPVNFPIANIFLPDLHLLQTGRYLRRWARRLREEGFSGEDTLLLSYASFGVDEEREAFGVGTVLTTDYALKRRYEGHFTRLRLRFDRMTRQLKSPYRFAQLPSVLTPEEVLAILVGD